MMMWHDFRAATIFCAHVKPTVHRRIETQVHHTWLEAQLVARRVCVKAGPILPFIPE